MWFSPVLCDAYSHTMPLTLDLEELDELLPSSDQPDTPQGTEESTPASMEASLATDVREDGSKIAITRTWDLQTSGLGVVEVVCKEAMSKYRTCAACELPPHR